MSTMKAAVWTDIDKIEIQEVPIPEIGENEALIKVKAAGVCVTDYHVITGKLKIGHTPNIQGHEICGEVYKINSDKFKIGQRCVIATSLGCGKCDYCKEGKVYLCKDGGEIGYYPNNGGYAEYVKVPVSAIVPIPDNFSDLSGSILESCVCPYESLMNNGVKKGSICLVTGNGPAALAYISMLKLFGASKVISLIRNDDKVNLVKEYGADEVIVSKTDYIVRKVMIYTNDEKCDLVIDATGAKEYIELLPYLCRKGGKIILYGIPGEDEAYSFPIKKLICDEISIHGAVGNVKAWVPLVDLISEGKINIERMITHKYKLDDINEAFNLYRNHDRKIVKAVIEF